MASLTYGNKYFVVKSEKETSREGYNIVDVLCDEQYCIPFSKFLFLT